MPKKDTKLIQLSEKVQSTVEEIKNLGVENLDHMFLEIYSSQASRITDSRQQSKVKHLLKDVVGIAFFAVLAGYLPMIRYSVSFSSCALTNCRTCL